MSAVAAFQGLVDCVTYGETACHRRGTNRMKTFTKLAAAALLATTLGPVASAQNAPVANKWYKVCSQQDQNEICSIQFTRVSPQGRPVNAINLLKVNGKVNREIFQIMVPSGRFIPAGIKMRIDGGRENTIPYSICLPDRCLAETKLTPALVSALKSGNNVSMVTTNFRNQQNPMEITLSGFTAAFDGPPLKRDELQNQQTQLKQELEKKAADARAKLLEAQEKAKAGTN